MNKKSFTPTLKGIFWAYWGKSDLQEVLNLVIIGKRKTNQIRNPERKAAGQLTVSRQAVLPPPIPGPSLQQPSLHKQTLDGLPRSPAGGGEGGQRCRVERGGPSTVNPYLKC